MKYIFRRRTIKLPYGISVLVISSFFLFFVPLFRPDVELVLTRISLAALLFFGALLVDDTKKIYLYTAVVLTVLRMVGFIFDLNFFSMVIDVLTVPFFAWVSIQLINQIIHKEASSIVIVESLAGYLLLCISLTTIMSVIMYFDPHAFSFPASMLQNKEDANMSMYSYFVVITYTTVGYGDVLPMTSVARSLAKFTALSGQIYMAVVVAILIGKYLQAKD